MRDSVNTEKFIMTKATGRSTNFFLIGVIVFAFALRLSVTFATGSYRVVEDDTDHFGFGWEMGRVARSIDEGKGFSSPLPLPTGPTAIVGPVYPVLLAGIFKLFGVYSTSSAIVVRIMQSAFASLTCLFLYLCGRDAVGESTGKLAALLWVVFPLNIFFTSAKVWETSLSGLLVAALLWTMLPLRDSLSITRWSATGALLAIAGLTNTSLVVLILPFAIAALWRSRARVLLPACLGALTCLVLVSPWVIRNYHQFGKVMLRSNFPLEFRIGNNEFSYGQKIEALHPSNTPSINQHWQEVGESQFMEEERVANAQYLSTHHGRFAFSTVNRIVNYWTGAWIKPIEGFSNSWPVIISTSALTLLGLLGIGQMFRRGIPAAAMFAGCLLIYPVAYYLTTSQPRFYHAMTPLLIMATSYWMVNILSQIRLRATAQQKPSTATAA